MRRRHAVPGCAAAAAGMIGRLKLSDRQQKELRRMHDTGDYSIRAVLGLPSDGVPDSRPTGARHLGSDAEYKRLERLYPKGIKVTAAEMAALAVWTWSGVNVSSALVET